MLVRQISFKKHINKQLFHNFLLRNFNNSTILDEILITLISDLDTYTNLRFANHHQMEKMEISCSFYFSTRNGLCIYTFICVKPNKKNRNDFKCKIFFLF